MISLILQILPKLSDESSTDELGVFLIYGNDHTQKLCLPDSIQKMQTWGASTCASIKKCLAQFEKGLKHKHKHFLTKCIFPSFNYWNRNHQCFYFKSNISFKKCSISKLAPFRPKQFRHTENFKLVCLKVVIMCLKARFKVLKCNHKHKCLWQKSTWKHLQALPCLKCFQAQALKYLPHVWP